MCEDCAESTCSVCMELDLCETVGPAMCEMCMEFCNDCDVSFHRCCKATHLASCNSKTRAQRNASAAAQKLADTEGQLKDKKSLLARIQSEIENLEQKVKTAKEDKERADKLLAKETADSEGKDATSNVGVPS